MLEFSYGLIYFDLQVRWCVGINSYCQLINVGVSSHSIFHNLLICTYWLNFRYISIAMKYIWHSYLSLYCKSTWQQIHWPILSVLGRNVHNIRECRLTKYHISHLYHWRTIYLAVLLKCILPYIRDVIWLMMTAWNTLLN